ncbi:MAG: methyltransferase domain-containing protein [Planctomycetes bacterium]|nr:methyltransferase domain-containing protein [Planctomycetota bacterium]
MTVMPAVVSADPPGVLDPRLAAVLVCPVCRRVLSGGAALRCAACSVDYPVVRGIPVLLPPATARRLESDRRSWGDGMIRPRGVSYDTLVRLAAPKPHVWPGESAAVRALCAKAPAGAALVDIGCGCARAPEGVWRMDIGPDPGTHVAGDAHALPFADRSLDGVFIFRVLEHVAHPEEVVSQIRRVLRPGGFVAAVVPFLEPYHRNPLDHSRFCQDGVERLFGDFEREHLRWVAGPSAALAWILKEYLAICFPFSNHPLVYAGVRETAGWMLSPLRWFDALLRRKTFAHKIACEFFYVGRKRS